MFSEILCGAGRGVSYCYYNYLEVLRLEQKVWFVHDHSIFRFVLFCMQSIYLARKLFFKYDTSKFFFRVKTKEYSLQDCLTLIGKVYDLQPSRDGC